MNTTSKVITRFPPSPTGNLHIGGVRTAIFNYLFARQNEGEFVFRFEDTDRERSKKEFEQDIIDTLEWLGLDYDNTAIERQSERTDVYVKHLQSLIEKGNAYEAEESQNTKHKTQNTKVIRFKNPNKKITFTDIIRGEVTVDTTDLEDFVIARNSESPLYHLTVVVDDHDMKITHVIRGEEHVSNTPRQILILEALGFERPTYAHIPLILAPDKSKLSKRHGAVSALEYQREGYLPEALFNYLTLLGWHPQDDQEIFSKKGLMEAFDLSRVQKGGAVFDIQKLNSINKEYIQKLPDDVFEAKVKEFLPERITQLPDYSDEMLRKVLLVIRERIEKFDDIEGMTDRAELNYFFTQQAYETKDLLWKKEPSQEKTAHHIETVIDKIKNIPSNEFIQKSVKEAIWSYAEQEGKGNVLWPMRYALSGQEKSPDPFQLSEILGQDETISRLKRAVKKLHAK